MNLNIFCMTPHNSLIAPFTFEINTYLTLWCTDANVLLRL